MEGELSKRETKNINNMETVETYTYTIATEAINIPVGLRLLGWNAMLTLARRIRKAFYKWKNSDSTVITINNIEEHEEYLYRTIQIESFAREVAELKRNKNIFKNSSIVNLKPYLDERDVLRVNGRASGIKNINFNNNPIILDSKHIITKLLIADYHRRFFHGSNETIVNELRQTYFILGLRNSLRSISSRCIICRINKGKPKEPLMSALPESRVAFEQRPFTHCGIDYFGPLIIKTGRRREKRWGVLFTCLSVRAIHLEIANNLTSSSVILALQRFAARRGTPSYIYSDNGTNFRGACRELKEAIRELNDEKLQSFVINKRISWRFNPPDAPHMGGAWKRLIRSVKTALKIILKDQVVSEEVLYTIFTEIEHSVNSRPLTHVPIDPRDPEALTPNHFLIGSSSGEIRLGNVYKHDICSRKQWRAAQYFADCF